MAATGPGRVKTRIRHWHAERVASPGLSAPAQGRNPVIDGEVWTAEPGHCAALDGQ